MCVAQADGELYVAAQDMEISNRVSGNISQNIYANCAAVLADFNLSSTTLSEIIVETEIIGKPVFIDPTSVFRIPARFWIMSKVEERV